MSRVDNLEELSSSFIYLLKFLPAYHSLTNVGDEALRSIECDEEIVMQRRLKMKLIDIDEGLICI